MEILRKGNTSTKWVGQCSKCKAIVRANESELSEIRNGDYRNDYEDYTWENCPSCNKNSICFHAETSKFGKRILKELE